MSKGVKIIILFFIGFLAIFLIIYFFYFQGRALNNIQEVPSENSVASLPPAEPENIVRGGEIYGSTENIVEDNVVQTDNSISEELKKTEISRMVFSFVERFGSYSGESRFQNLRDLQVFMTDTMKQWSENFINKHTEDAFQEIDFEKITTKSLVVKDFSIDDDAGIANLLITTQRRKVLTGNSQEEVFYQDIMVKLKNVDDQWKVESAYWQ